MGAGNEKDLEAGRGAAYNRAGKKSNPTNYLLAGALLQRPKALAGAS